MSLINDALKRAKQAQAQKAPAAVTGPQLRPVEAATSPQRPIGLVVPIFLAILIGIGLLLVWGRFHPRATPETVTKSTSPVQTPSAASSAAVAASKPPEPLPQTSTQPHPKEQPVTVEFGPPSSGSPIVTDSKPVPPEIVAAVPAEKTAATNSSALKLTGIVFHPSRPAAMIGGKMLFLNDKIGDWRVVKIDRESATLANASQTNTLSLTQ
jgi:hypothetical protein